LSLSLAGRRHDDRRSCGSGQWRPDGALRRLRVDDHHEASGKLDGLTIRAQHPLRPATGLRFFVVGVEDSVPVQKHVERCRNANAAFRLNAAETPFEHVRVGGMHLQAHLAHAAVAKPLVSRLYQTRTDG